jgi:hypothetical protein
MSEGDAEALAARVRALTADKVTVVDDEDEIVVQVQTGHGRYTLRDEDDWEWLKIQILRAE